MTEDGIHGMLAHVAQFLFPEPCARQTSSWLAHYACKHHPGLHIMLDARVTFDVLKFYLKKKPCICLPAENISTAQHDLSLYSSIAATRIEKAPYTGVFFDQVSARV
jgi:hypothetical protein